MADRFSSYYSPTPFEADPSLSLIQTRIVKAIQRTSLNLQVSLIREVTANMENRRPRHERNARAQAEQQRIERRIALEEDRDDKQAELHEKQGQVTTLITSLAARETLIPTLYAQQAAADLELTYYRGQREIAQTNYDAVAPTVAGLSTEERTTRNRVYRPLVYADMELESCDRDMTLADEKVTRLRLRCQEETTLRNRERSQKDGLEDQVRDLRGEIAAMDARLGTE